MNEQVQETHPDADGAQPKSLAEALQIMPAAAARRLRLARLAGWHGLVWLGALGLFAAADSWVLLSGLGLASLLAVVAGALAGITTTTLVHEWFHLAGVRFAGGAYDIPDKLGLFVYDWDFDANDSRQFVIMSIAGSVGGVLSLLLVWMVVPADTLGRAALYGGTVAGFVFASIVEWPVLSRVRAGGAPLAELSKINERVLTRAFFGAAGAGVLTLLLLSP